MSVSKQIIHGPNFTMMIVDPKGRAILEKSEPYFDDLPKKGTDILSYFRKHEACWRKRKTVQKALGMSRRLCTALLWLLVKRKYLRRVYHGKTALYALSMDEFKRKARQYPMPIPLRRRSYVNLRDSRIASCKNPYSFRAGTIRWHRCTLYGWSFKLQHVFQHLNNACIVVNAMPFTPANYCWNLGRRLLRLVQNKSHAYADHISDDIASLQPELSDEGWYGATFALCWWTDDAHVVSATCGHRLYREPADEPADEPAVESSTSDIAESHDAQEHDDHIEESDDYIVDHDDGEQDPEPSDKKEEPLKQWFRPLDRSGELFQGLYPTNNCFGGAELFSELDIRVETHKITKNDRLVIASMKDGSVGFSANLVAASETEAAATLARDQARSAMPIQRPTFECCTNYTAIVIEPVA